MPNVYPWPPVQAFAKFWNLDLPVSKSYSMVNGRRFASSSQPARRVASIETYTRRDYGFGYMAALERMLAGGQHLVRLTSCRMAYGVVDDLGADGRSGSYFSWRQGHGEPLFNWRTTDAANAPGFLWFEGASFSVTSILSGGRIVDVTGDFPPGAIVAIPGEFIRVYTAANPAGEVHMVTNVARADSTANNPRVVRLKLASAVSGPGRVDINSYEEGIFELTDQAFPQLGRPGSDIPNITLNFREVFPGEIGEALVEVNPWT